MFNETLRDIGGARRKAYQRCTGQERGNRYKLKGKFFKVKGKFTRGKNIIRQTEQGSGLICGLC